ncbi:trihelix transcription factor ASIL2-like [Chenopodium quinoa]|uniref:trihelix transcription factor ASIL2-like n=1 Tax=Chenopodium quinoa TaxID=63459 RepID=UPI000B774AC6|nr:trihelix transcription factor ASIL2-like [Chenopodium quinoa]
MPSPPSASVADPSPPPGNLPPPPVVRKFPAPCWTQDETLALIHAYQDKWYSLRRRNLRTADWEAVADEVNRRCPDQSPPKSSAQCRHKMEKLRKRYRAEKQRIGALPSHNNFVGNRFFPSSSWVFFDLMDAMEVGSGSGPGSTSVVNNNGVNNGGNNHNMNMNVLNPVNQNNGGFVKEEKLRGKDDLGKYFDEILMGMGKSGSGSGGPIKFRVKNHGNSSSINNNERYFDEGYDYDGGNNGSGFDYKNGRSNFASGFSKRKLGEDSSSSKMFLNGCSSSKKGFGLGAGSRARGGRDAAAGEMVASIKMLGEALVRTEKEKMEMMQEMEMKWMEMEMKRTQMLLEAQHNIVNAFVQGFKKQKKVKVMEVE